MTTNRHKYFRWTRRTAWLSFAYVMLVPAMLGTAGYMTEVSEHAEEELKRIGQWLISDPGQVGYAWKEEGRHDL